MAAKISKVQDKLLAALEKKAPNASAFVDEQYDPMETATLLKVCRLLLKKEKDPVRKAMLHMLVGRIYHDDANFDDAAKEALLVSKMKDIPTSVTAYAYGIIASIYTQQGDFVRAEKLCKSVLALTGETESETFVLAVNTIGNIHYYNGRFALALEYYDTGIRITKKLGLKKRAIVAIINSALALGVLGRLDEVIKRLEEARKLAQEVGDDRSIAQVAVTIGDNYLKQGELEKALEQLSEGLRLTKKIGQKSRLAEIYTEIARAHFGLEQFDLALENAMKGLSLAEKMNQKIHIASSAGMVGLIHNHTGNADAENFLKKSIETYRAWPSDVESVGLEYSLFQYGKFLLPKNKNEALQCFQEAAAILMKRPSSENVKKKLEETRDILHELGVEIVLPEEKPRELEKGQENLKKALEISKTINLETSLNNILNIIVDGVLEISGAERGFIVFMEDGLWKTTISRNFPEDITEESEYPAIQKIIQNSLKSGKPMMGGCRHTSRVFESDSVEVPDSVRTLLVFPLAVGEEILGCIYIDSRVAAMDISSDLEDLMTAVMEHAAFVIAKTSQYESIRNFSEKLEHRIERQNMELRRTRTELEKKQQELELKHHYKNIIGKSSKMREIFRLLDEITGNDLPVSIEGESGTGKELVAKAIHYNGPRKKKNFLAINCAAIPESLMESELFGYEKGAFTGADERKAGIFEQANGGTLFLDEIGNMSPVMQQKLLRVVQENEVRRLGSDSPLKVDVRIISATNKSLSDLVAGGTFREDLFYRLNVLPITLPPLRDRKEDIPLLVEYFWKKISPYTEIPENDKGELLKLLNDYDWPGNVRELENEITRLASLGKTGFNIKYLSRHILHESRQSGVPMGIFLSEESLTLPEIEKRCIVAALENAKGNKTKAAELLGIPRTSIDSKMKKLNIRLAELVYEY
ncbi:MAG: tetratricopeptide repeat protein [Planctomycetota bacterium]|nr:MAG: tetratricopeptide repeat protein [Planctomycetota bacterium]